jgi:hypothetical protein
VSGKFARVAVPPLSFVIVLTRSDATRVVVIDRTPDAAAEGHVDLAYSHAAAIWCTPLAGAVVGDCLLLSVYKPEPDSSVRY